MGQFESHHCSCGGLYGDTDHFPNTPAHPLYHVPKDKRPIPDDLVDVLFKYPGFLRDVVTGERLDR